MHTDYKIVKPCILVAGDSIKAVLTKLHSFHSGKIGHTAPRHHTTTRETTQSAAGRPTVRRGQPAPPAAMLLLRHVSTNGHHSRFAATDICDLHTKHIPADRHRNNHNPRPHLHESVRLPLVIVILRFIVFLFVRVCLGLIAVVILGRRCEGRRFCSDLRISLRARRVAG